VPVRKGDALLELNSPEKAELLSRWIEAKAESERAEATLRREESLLPHGATSAREVEEARATATFARAGLEAARLGLEGRGLDPEDRTGRHVVRAPRNGSVLSWSVRLGESVAAGTALGEFQSAAARLVRVELPLPGPPWTLGDRTEVRASDGTRWAARVVGLPAALGDEYAAPRLFASRSNRNRIPCPGSRSRCASRSRRG
jgi:Multidrug resistance efflux pump